MNLRYLASGCVVLVASNAFGHGVPTVISLSDDGTTLVAPARPGVVVMTGGATDSDEPGFGFGVASAAPPVGTRLGVETTGGLLYWDGVEIAPTEATLSIEAPDFDHFGVPNTSAVPEYVVTEDSGPLTGLTWSTVGGGDFWHANGFFTIAGLPGEPRTGVYGVPIRLVTMPDGPQLGPTDPFVLPIFYDPFGEWTATEALEGIDALEAALAQPADFNGDGFVDGSDYAVWSANHGANALTSGDATGDGLVNAADYTAWRDATNINAAMAVPEPHALSLLVVAIVLANRRPKRDEPFRSPVGGLSEADIALHRKP
ncbi:MAG: hypothetical protein AAF266_09990 [Planctomycetota bacterium]